MINNMWILVAHRGGARLFENKGPGKGLNLLHDIPHPEGRLKNKEIGSDSPGRSFDSRGQGHHALSAEQEPTAHVAEQFARQLSSMLDTAATSGATGNSCRSPSRVFWATCAPP